ncbi:MAG: prepilin-type N-terminal cleavage/methylation domain-containing protein [Planctomycetota bacterium]
MDRRLKAFSLVELIIVVVVIGLIAAIAVPRFSKASEEASTAAMKANIDEIQKAVDLYQAEHGDYPLTIDPAWFISQEVPPHVFSPDNPVAVEIATEVDLWNPVSISVNPENDWTGYWYNPNNGVVRSRVTDQGTAARTLLLYQKVNGL